MKGTETGKDKVKKICEMLRHETLEPAKKEAEELIDTAVQEAERMINEGRRTVEQMMQEARLDIQRQKNVFESSLNQACKQALSALKQSIEEKLFDHELMKSLSAPLRSPQVLAQLITAIVKGIEKDGVDADLSVIISSAVAPREVNQLLGHEILERLKEKSVIVGPLASGVEVKLHQNNMTVDLSDQAVKELVGNYIRKDFRQLIFGNHK